MTTMAKARILVTRHLPPEVESRLERDFAASLNVSDKIMSTAEIAEKAKAFDGLLITSMDPCRKELIDALPASIRMIATFSVGTDHIDIPAAKAKGIAVANTPDVLTDATADIALLLMLGAARGAIWGDRMVRENKWLPPSATFPLGHDVSGRRLGIYGMGRIGQAVAKRAAAFGMTLHYHNRKPVAADLSSWRDLPRNIGRHAAALRFSLDQLRVDGGNPRQHQCPRHWPAAGWGNRGELGARRHRQ